jgi:hypothetical protein
MKTIDELLAQPSVYLGNWHSKFEVVSDFVGSIMPEDEFNSIPRTVDYDSTEITDANVMAAAMEDYGPLNILFAYSGIENKHQEAFVLFEYGGVIYVVWEIIHTTIRLEGTFQPKQVDLDLLKYNLENGNIGVDFNEENIFADELKQFLGI